MIIEFEVYTCSGLGDTGVALLADGLRIGGGGGLARLDLGSNALTSACVRPLADAAKAWYRVNPTPLLCIHKQRCRKIRIGLKIRIRTIGRFLLLYCLHSRIRC